MSVKPGGPISFPVAANQCETMYHVSGAAQRLQSWNSSRGAVLRKPAHIWAILGPVPI